MAKRAKTDLTGMNIPTHVAIILDGNGRWAKKKHLPRTAGHSAGAKMVERITEEAYHIGIKYLTVYAFSTENWSRPKDEVKTLMRMLRNYLAESIEKANKNNMRVLVIGDREQLDQDIIDSINKLEESSKKNDGITL